MKRYQAVLLTVALVVLCFAWTRAPHTGWASEGPAAGRSSPAGSSPAGPDNSSTLTPERLPATPSKLEPQLLRQVLQSEATDQIRFVVELAQQADLTALQANLSRGERQSLVVAHLQTTARETQANLLAFLEVQRSEGHVQRYRSFWVFNGLAVTADADTLLTIAARPEVRLVREDRWQQWVDPQSVEESLETSSGSSMVWNLEQIRADLAWTSLGIDGNGVTVAIMDTGADWQHPALQNQYRGYKPGGLSIHEGNWLCATDEGYLYPYDGYGHGTHVTGTAVGGRDADGVAIGVAPGAQWIAAKVFNDGGFAYDSWIHSAFEWLMAPSGDPALAPDVVNSSWGSPLGQDETFRPDLQAVRAAGIVPIFSAGNDGPYPGTVGSPGSHPEAIAVGATDDLDQVTRFSSRGPSPWGEIKPEVSAPGAQILSSLPGGSYGTMYGTSMAAPHVTGLVALLLQADPTLSVDDVEAILTSTTLPLGEPIPNNNTGWGRIDAYRAVAVALHAGYVNGLVTRQPDLQPLPYAFVTAFDREGELQGQVAVDEDGHYELALPEGTYSIQVTAFGYEPYRVQNVTVVASASVTVDVALRLAPAGVLWGHITDADTGGPLGVQVSVDGTPAHTVSDDQTGRYSLALPAGTYTVTVRQNGYRRISARGVEIAVDKATRVDFSLVAAPTLLLVDSGRWYYNSQASYFQSALDDRDYVYDLWEIRNLSTDIPTGTDLEPYDVTIWSAPFDSPGLIDAGDVISGYLTSGGNLLLTGQDIGYWDSGLGGWLWEDYYRDLLKAAALDDDAGRVDVIGLPGQILDGLALEINGDDSARNQTTPDLIDVLDHFDAALVANYEGVGGAALRANGCQSYRAVYLAAGLEGLGDQGTRAEVMDRALTWLDSPQPVVEIRLAPLRQETVWIGGSTITYTVKLQNRGQSVDQFDLELSGSAWPVSVMDSTFTQEITQSLTLGQCLSQTVGISVTVPPEIGWNVTDVVTLTARSQSDPGVAAQAAFASKTPAPILLVDDHRWYDYSARYRAALEARGLPYDPWRNLQAPTPDFGSPTLQRLAQYPVVIWFTGYDWYNTLTPSEEATLSAYLDGGGRLAFSSQDYLYTSGLTNFGRDRLGVLRHTEDLTVTRTVGAVGHPVGDGRATLDLFYPFRNYSDALRPSPAAAVAFWGQHGQPAALTVDSAPWKTAFYAFALEAFGPPDLAEVLGDTVAWLSPLGDSTLAVDLPVVSAGEELAYTLSIRNTGPRPLEGATLDNPVPPGATFVPGSLEGPASYDPGTQSITWSGALDLGQEISVAYRLLLDRQIQTGAIIENVAHLSDGTGLTVECAAISHIDSPYLGNSTKTVSALLSPPGRVLTYTLSLRNDGLRPADAQLLDPIPANSHHLPGSGWASSGLLTSTAELLTWTGTLEASEAVTITFPVTVNTAIRGFYVYNRATLTDGWGDRVPLETQTPTLVEVRLYLPLILRGP